MATSGLGKILIIDRDLHITMLLRCNLRDEGYDVDVQPDAAEAMRNDLSDVRVVILYPSEIDRLLHGVFDS